MENKVFKDKVADYLLGSTSDDLDNEILELQTLMSYYKCAMHEIEGKFKVLNEQFSLQHERNPIESIKTRLKSFSSIREKLERKGLPITTQSIWDNLNDVAGIRVVCSFLDDIHMLAYCLISQDDVKLIEIKDYIKHPKSNGYRSLHLIVEIPIFLLDDKRYVRAEVQLRTINMNSWAKLEHRMIYKKNLSEAVLAETRDELCECAEMSHQLDLKMQAIRNIVEK